MTDTPAAPAPAKKRRAKFPYDTFEEALADKFKKIGGYPGALRCLQKGWKTIIWRKRADLNAKEVAEIQDAAVAKANEAAAAKAASHKK